jgi:pimeloyl-ACP methyl ester carboxylesterase
MFLHGAGNDESSYLDQNNRQMVRLAEEHHVILVSPLGYQGSYGTFIRLPAVFDEQAEADKLLAQVTAQTLRANELSEKDVINVLELVLNEYPVDSARIFLTGHSMGSGGTWYLGGKYSRYWRALAPMSGPFVLKNGYPWETVLRMPVFVTEGSNTASTESSRRLRDWMQGQNGEIAFKEVAADHAGMVPLVLPDVFAFFDSVSGAPVFLDPMRRTRASATWFHSCLTFASTCAYPDPGWSGGTRYFDVRGRLTGQ